MITSKYVTATNYRPSRIKVEHTLKKVKRFYSYNHELNSRDNHIEAVKRFCEELCIDDNLFQMDCEKFYAYSRLIRRISDEECVTPEGICQ